jgi:hypothetical protein
MVVMKWLSLLCCFVGLVFGHKAYARRAGTYMTVSALVSYSASLKEAASSDFYEGIGYGATFGLQRSRWEPFVSYRQSRQHSNYTNIDNPELMDRHARLGLRWERSWMQAIFPVFEIGADLVLPDPNGLGLGYGGSGGVGIGGRMGSAMALRLVSELNLISFPSDSLRRRLFNLRSELVLRF